MEDKQKLSWAKQVEIEEKKKKKREKQKPNNIPKIEIKNLFAKLKDECD